MPGVLRIGAAMASTLILLAPAIWNRFPLLQYDTGGYLVRWFEGYLVPSRSTVFGLFLNIFAYPDFWPVVVVQAALTVWVLALMLRALGFGGRPLVLLGVTAALSVLTTLPWLTSILLTDIFAGLAVLAVHLLVFADGTLRRFERIALVALIAFAVATHSATFAVVVALLAAAALAWWYLRIGSASGIARGMAAVALGAVMLRRRQLRGRRPARLDAGRPRAVVRPHAPGRHRQPLPRRPLPGAADEALRAPPRAADRRRRVLLERQGQRVQQPRPLRRAWRRDERHRRSAACATIPPGRSRWRWPRRRIS